MTSTSTWRSVDASRVRKLVGDSKHVLADLHDEGARFDFVYVDGSHLALDVLVDAALSWHLLASTDFSSSTTTGGRLSATIRYSDRGAAIDAFPRAWSKEV